MAKILIVISSGPEDFDKCKEGLDMARAINQAEMAEVVEILLVGAAVRCLSTKDDLCAGLNDALQEAILHGVPVSACTRSLDQNGLIGDLDEEQSVTPVGAPIFLSSRAGAGYAMISF